MSIIYVSKSGSDIIGTGVVGNPFLTITHALSSALSGDIILIGDGTYQENITINKSITLKSQTGVKTDVTISSLTSAITVSPSTSNVFIRDLTILTVDTVNPAVVLQITRDFTINPSGLPVLTSQIDNFNLINCVINYNKAGVSGHAKNSNFLSNTFIQTGSTSSHRCFLLYSIENVSIMDNVHETATAGLSSFLYLTISGGGEYRKRTLYVKNNRVNVINPASSGHFLLCETTDIDPLDSTRFRIDFQHNVFITSFSPLDTGGLFIIYPTNSSNFTQSFDNVSYSIIANNTVTNPYRGWVYFDITSAQPSFDGSMYFKIYDNVYTEVSPVYRPSSWDVDSPSSLYNVLVSTTPNIVTNWSSIYNTDLALITSLPPINESDADEKLTEVMKISYPNDSISIPLSLFSLNSADDLEMIEPVLGYGSGTFSSNVGSNAIVCSSVPSIYKILIYAVTPFYAGNSNVRGSFAVKVYNILTGEIMTNIQATPLTLRYDAGVGNENLSLTLNRYIHPIFSPMVNSVVEVSPHIYEFILDTNSIYNLTINETTSNSTLYILWIVLTAILIIVFLISWKTQIIGRMFNVDKKKLMKNK